MGLNVPFGVPVELLDEERDGVRAPELAAGDGDVPLGESIRYAVVARQGGSTEPQSKNRDIDGGKLPFKQQCRTAVARRKAYHGVTCRGETRPGVRVGDPCVVPDDGEDDDDYEGLTVEQLRELLKKCKLETSGRKRELVERLRGAEDADEA